MENFVEVYSKKSKWLIDKDLNIYRPETTTLVTRTRKGKKQTFLVTEPIKKLSPQFVLGYQEVAYTTNKIRYRETIHRLIAKAFVPGYFDGAHVNHINGIKTDNRPENLEWVTIQQNNRHAIETGLLKNSGEFNINAKLTFRKVQIIRNLLRLGASCNELADLTDVSQSLISLIRDGKRWKEVISSIGLNSLGRPA